jgi:hypothetical protein
MINNLHGEKNFYSEKHSCCVRALSAERKHMKVDFNRIKSYEKRSNEELLQHWHVLEKFMLHFVIKLKRKLIEAFLI